MKSEAPLPSPAPKKRGRPSSGVPRREQVRLAAKRRRERLRYAVDASFWPLQFEATASVYFTLRDYCEKKGLTVKEACNRLLGEALCEWRFPGERKDIKRSILDQSFLKGL